MEKKNFLITFIITGEKETLEQLLESTWRKEIMEIPGCPRYTIDSEIVPPSRPEPDYSRKVYFSIESLENLLFLDGICKKSFKILVEHNVGIYQYLRDINKTADTWIELNCGRFGDCVVIEKHRPKFKSALVIIPGRYGKYQYLSTIFLTMRECLEQMISRVPFWRREEKEEMYSNMSRIQGVIREANLCPGFDVECLEERDDEEKL